MLLTAQPKQAQTVTSAPESEKELKVITKEDWALMSEDERFKYLERLHYVPQFAEMPRDWLLAQKTTWWGNPIDPQEFWKDRVLWIDRSAESAAQSRGRAFPPMPYDDPSLPKYSGDKEVNPTQGSLEGPNLHFHWTSKESAFWTKFIFSHPRPPEDIQTEQQRVAAQILGQRFDFDHRGNPARTNPKWLQDGEKFQVDRAIAAGYPTEAFTDGALFWAYVAKAREGYQALVDPATGQQSSWATNFLNSVPVPTNYVIQPLTEEQINDANAWKTLYLQRLRAEETNEPYISAYLRAWNLSST
jgi:hypothetical protein